MRINVSTVFRILALFVQDVLELESKEKVAVPGELATSPAETPVATDSQTPAK